MTSERPQTNEAVTTALDHCSKCGNPGIPKGSDHRGTAFKCIAQGCDQRWMA